MDVYDNNGEDVAPQRKKKTTSGNHGILQSASAATTKRLAYCGEKLGSCKKRTVFTQLRDFKMNDMQRFSGLAGRRRVRLNVMSSWKCSELNTKRKRRTSTKESIL